MKCKSCGGELRFQDGIYICQSCNVTYTLDSVYENIEVCICYEESDSAGRRTKDSVVAQEVYRKLEENKITTFYERISADGLIGRNLEESKLAAIHRAQVIVVLGTSIDNFSAIETKYSEHFSGKPVVPFCVDVNPGAIPQTLSKIQAMSYSTIGWDKDLIKGVYNILGREQLVDTGSLYGKRKTKLLVVGIIAAVIAVAVGIAAWILLKPNDISQDSNTDVSSTSNPNESTTKPLSQKEIYDKASELLEQGGYVEALHLFLQIPDHPNSANMIKQIYSKYEGYYQIENISLYLDVVDNIQATFEIKIVGNGEIIRISESSEILSTAISCEYVDNFQGTGTVELALENTGLRLRLIPKEDAAIELFFELSQKSDKPTLQINRQMLVEWVEKEYTYSQITNLGFNLEFFDSMDFQGAHVHDIENNFYRIEGTEIYLSMVQWYQDTGEIVSLHDDAIVIGVAGPAELLAPSLVGSKSVPDVIDNVLYWPNALLNYDVGYIFFLEDYFESSETEILSDTIIGMTIKTPRCTEYGWDEIATWAIHAQVEKATIEFYELEATDYSYIWTGKVAENANQYLYQVSINNDEGYMRTAFWIWCKLDKKSKGAEFITETTVTYDTRGNNYPRFEDIAPPDEWILDFPEYTEPNKTTTNSTEQTPPTETEEPALPVIYSVHFDKEVAVYSKPAEKNGIGCYPSENDEIVCYLPAGTYNIVGYRRSSCIWGELEGGIGWICYSDSDIISFDE